MLPRAPAARPLAALFLSAGRLQPPAAPMPTSRLLWTRVTVPPPSARPLPARPHRAVSFLHYFPRNLSPVENAIARPLASSARAMSSVAAPPPPHHRSRPHPALGLFAGIFVAGLAFGFNQKPVLAEVKADPAPPPPQRRKSLDKIPVEGELHISERVGRVERVFRTLEFILRTTIAVPALLLFFLVVAVPLAVLNIGRKSDTFSLVGPLFYRVMRPIMGISVAIKGAEHLDGARPCVVLCAPHQSSMDVYIAASFVPGGSAAIGKKELAYIPIFNIFLWLSPVVLIDRANTKNALEALAEASKTVAQERLRLILFPEGTRTRVLGPRLLPLKKGGFRMALDNGLPIVPVVISNTADAFYPLRWWWKGGEVEVRVLDPVRTEGLGADDLEALMEDVRGRMLTEMEDMERRRRK